MNRVFIIGWDGATFDLIKPWVAEGKLPNIAAIMNEGTVGPLRSTMPPMTFPAWSSFMTGKNPGKHGIFDFTRQRPGKYEIEFVNGGQRQSASFWQILSEAGRKVISISVPCTYPPEPVNGVMISGFDAPGLGGSGSRVDSRGMHPPELFQEIDREVGGHPIGSFPMAEINQGRPDLAIQKILEAIREKAATTKYLMQNHPWDVCMILFGESDGVGHHFWKYCDPESPLFTNDPPGQEDSIFKVYEELDRQIGELRELLPEDTTILMMSDHGFGGVSNAVLYPNCWLHEQGLLDFRGGASKRYSRILDAIKLRAVAFLPSKVKRMLYRFAKGRLGKIESAVRYSMIEWQGTKAYFEENPYYPVLWINLKGRQPDGTVVPGAEYETLRDRLIEKLEDWRHPETGEKIVEKAYKREEIYSGSSLENAPDIVVKWNEHENYTYAFKLSSKSESMNWTEDVDPNKAENLVFFTGKSGSHRDDGIFLAHGPGIRQAAVIENAKIIDLAPTILHLLDVPVPEDMDGKVLEDVFSEEYGTVDVKTTAHSSKPTVNSEHGTYSSEDEQTIEDRLRSLGYIN